MANKYAGEENICIVTGEPGADLHHIITRGAGGGDEPWNLLPISHRLHQEIHMTGLSNFARKYMAARIWLTSMLWSYCSFRGKWVREQL